MVGHNLEAATAFGSQDDVNFLSYSGSIVSDLSFPGVFEPGTTVAKCDKYNYCRCTNCGDGIQIQVTNTSAVKDAIWTAF